MGRAVTTSKIRSLEKIVAYLSRRRGEQDENMGEPFQTPKGIVPRFRFERLWVSQIGKGKFSNWNVR